MKQTNTSDEEAKPDASARGETVEQLVDRLFDLVDETNITVLDPEVAKTPISHFTDMIRTSAENVARTYTERGESIPPLVRSALNAGRPQPTVERTVSGGKIRTQIMTVPVEPMEASGPILHERSAVFRQGGTAVRAGERRSPTSRRSLKSPEV